MPQSGLCAPGSGILAWIRWNIEKPATNGGPITMGESLIRTNTQVFRCPHLVAKHSSPGATTAEDGRPPPQVHPPTLLIRRQPEEFLVSLEHRNQSCYAEQLLQALIQIDQLQFAMLPFGGQVHTDQRTETGTIHVVHIRQVQHHAFPFRDEAPDR